jgi:hypothetical protein
MGLEGVWMAYRVPTVLVQWRFLRGVEISDPTGTNGRKNYDLIGKGRCCQWVEVATALGFIPEHCPIEQQIREARLFIKRQTRREPVSIPDPGWFTAPGPTEAAYRTHLELIQRRVNIPRLQKLLKKGLART